MGPYTLPKDTTLFMSIFSAHHNTDVWPRVNDFVPERFLPVSMLHLGPRSRVEPRITHADMHHKYVEFWYEFVPA